MSQGDWWLILGAAVCVLVAGFFSSADAAMTNVSKVRADELVEEGRAGARRLAAISEDPARYLNTALLLRLLFEILAVVLVAEVLLPLVEPRWAGVLSVAGVMVVVQFVMIGVGPRTVGRQHAHLVALVSAPVVSLFTRVLGPLPQLLIVVGNIITPGRGFSEGPFSSEAELRELVDLAEASQVIESGERAMIHSVFELGDTITREVMVPRTDVVFIEGHKTLRQAMSLALRSGFSRIPVIDDNLDDIVGVVYLKDITKRVFDRHEAETTERVESVIRPVMYVPDSKPVDHLLRDMQAERKHVAVVVDEYGGTAGLVTIEDILEEIVGEITDEYDKAEVELEHLDDGSIRVSSRFMVDDLEDVCGVAIDDDDVDTLGGLMAKHLGRVPIPGSVVETDGLRFEAEGLAGRRNRISTVVVTRLHAADARDDTRDPREARDHGQGSDSAQLATHE